MGAYRSRTPSTLAERFSTQVRSCYLDTGVSPYKSFAENVFDSAGHTSIAIECARCNNDHTPGTQAHDDCLVTCRNGIQIAMGGVSAYSDGYLGNTHHKYLDEATGYTGVAQDNWGEHGPAHVT